MKGLAPLFIGIFGTFAFSWAGLTFLPNWQIGHLNPQSEEEGEDHYPQPQSGMVERGAHVYAANGCIYCHSEQVRADYAADDIERKWGIRRSAPRDYIFERPVFLGKMRIGQDLANIGARAPAEQASPSPSGAAAPGASPSGAANAAASPSPPPGGTPAAAAPAVKQTGSPAAQAQPGSPSPAASPAQSSSTSSAPSPPTSSPGGSRAAAAAVSGGSPPPAPPTGVASPSPGAMGTTAISSGAQPGTAIASSSGPQIAGAPWPLQAVGEPPMYSAEWHHVHLYSPRSTNLDSIMPAYRFLYEKRRITGERSAEALRLTGRDAPEEGWEVVPGFDAKCLVAYLMSRNQTHPLKDVRSVGGAPAPAAAAPAGASPSPAAAAAPAPAK
ncbi:MAG TPA: cbb3-type cytochrome c oxidase subunit II [Candidatus Udaeobacter sp.]|nr:cbb3-type cytochrome c oxidase subunit II [Candidatus Udaeobacter sp.]